ncbi:esterase [Nocardioides psychrotolerans]|uniref:Pimeloyl-ACP methyl ester carboxylesterase n=1 Tax=Nocardioides psychrotolerans TaxID=1005945 RepID=A0A1I3H897_9ACTN|nr:alpha/beta hydrolase [Nocardioides psychrotolerans]GEP37713.1 esterase [Nocardioides psychrotolerans]SFI31777.1 Pimeloyl-ACP methyl ester carboxylesterase [Nocardioides psychrotolerans]
MDIVLVAGLWLDGSAWDAVVPELEALGHRAVPITLPGQGDGAAATLDDQVAAVVAAIDAATGPALVVGHSAACTLAWLAADARPDTVAKVALIGGFPSTEGTAYAAFFPAQDGVMAFPGWGPFEGPDSDDLDQTTKDRIAAAAIPVPEAVATGLVRYTSQRRFDVPLVLVCPEFSPEQAREWIAGGDTPELSTARSLELVDLDSGHWPMFSQPKALAALLDEAAGS